MEYLLIIMFLATTGHQNWAIEGGTQTIPVEQVSSTITIPGYASEEVCQAHGKEIREAAGLLWDQGRAVVRCLARAPIAAMPQGTLQPTGVMRKR